MVECVMKQGKSGIVQQATALLLVLTSLLSLGVFAQEAGVDSMLGGAAVISGMSMGGAVNTDVSGLADPCMNAPDKAACAKKLMAGQVKTIQATPGVTQTTRGVNQSKKDAVENGNDFQNFIAASIGKNLPLFGYNLFEGSPDTFAPVDNIPITEDYLIGPGDEIVISAWGQVDINFHALVNRNGTIDLPKVGNVNVAGVRFQDLQGHLKNAIGRVFRNFELSVSLGKLRSIQVYVVGQAKRPGVFTVSSLSTLVNTLFASGGPLLNGSIRHIQVKRNGKIVTELDLYELLLKGDKSKDVALLPGDVIYIPLAKQYAAISGGIRNPAIYELKDDKSSLAELLDLAGGLTTTAAGQKVQLERIEDHKVRKVEEFLLDKDGLSKAIHDGDVVMVSAISTRFENAVKLQGNVARPMRYVWKQGMRITDVLKDANELLPQSYWEKQNSGDLGTGYHKKEVNWDYAVVQRLDQASLTTKLLAFNLGKAVKGDPIENMQLQSGDVITVYAADEDLPKTENDIVLKGSIFAPSNRRFVWREGMHINDLIPNAKWLTDYYDYWSNLHVGNNLKIDKAAQAEKLSTAINWGYANLVRLQPQDLTRMMLSFDLGKAVLQNDAANNLVLRPGDEITIFSNSEIHESGEREVKYITLEGEVKTPGVYPVGRGETLRQLIARLGGITSHAYLRGSVFTRESVREVQQKSLTEAIEKMKVELRAAEVQATSSAGIKPEELVIVKTKMAQQQATLDSMSKIKAAGRIVLELPEEEVKINDLPDLALEDGDKFSVPAMPSTVSVMGNVYNQSTFIFKPGNVVDDYLEKAGGATRDGDEKNIYVVLADGTVKANRATSFFSFNGGLNKRVLKPGDLVFVPQKIDIEYFSLSKAVMDWTQVFYQFVLGIAGGKAAGLW